MKKILLTLIIIFSTAIGISAQQVKQAFQLQFPIKCTINKDCWIMNYVDEDSTSNWHDYKSGRQTYEGHAGTDIAIKDLGRLKKGVDVLAAANGFVVATRDGVPDKNALSQDLKKLQDIGCGNRVAIKHSGGWVTDYCHMKNGSIKVKKGDLVMAGQKLGQVGMSGLTEFPHLHIDLQQGTKFFDPFTGLERYTKGTASSLWAPSVAQQLVYKPQVLYNVGVSNLIPKLLDIRDDKYKANRIGSDSEMIIVWIDSMHIEVGDSINVQVKTPLGTSFIKQNIIVDKPYAQKFFYLGRRKTPQGFAKGVYNVQITFNRPSAKITDNKAFTFEVY